jgi:hypothetical protein
MAETPPAEAEAIPRTAGAINWAAAHEQLRAAPDGEGADDLIDALTGAVFEADATVEATPYLVDAVRRARSDLSLRSAALALSIAAPADDQSSVDALVDSYRRAAGHPFLGPALLEAWGLLAVRSPLARAHLSALLLGLRAEGPRYVLVKAAQAIGHLDAVRPDPDLRTKLQEFASAEDPAVQAEARHQIALASLVDALLADDQTALRVRLAGARAAFARAERSEEHRPDAAVFVRLLDMLLAFLELGGDRATATERLARLAGDLDGAVMSLAPHDWHGYRSPRATFRARHMLRIADALRSAAETAGTAEEWTNFAASLEGLARLHAQIRADEMTPADDGRLPAALGGIADAIFAASLGPLLARVVQERRLARIAADYVLAHGEDGITRGLRALGGAAAAFATDSAAVEGIEEQLADLAKQVGRPPGELLAEAIAALQERRVPQWVEEIGLASNPLPVERPDLYGNDPSVDEVVRPLLHRIAECLGDYPLPKWTRLVDVLVSWVKFTHYMRDRMPKYVLCAEDGGLGQAASERDLQDGLFEWLRQAFGRTAVYELARSGGGRPDTGVVFPEARFPVEAKHEFDSIAPEHVRESFVAQSDVYATVADRVSFLTILDLRAVNAAGHRDRVRAKRKAGENPTTAALYHLRDSFWVESLPADPDVLNATSKVVVVGLVPGNRPFPSSMSTYSRRPSSARREREGSERASNGP